MTDIVETCFICAGSLSVGRTPEYDRCLNCGHETRKSRAGQSHMVNEILEPTALKRIDALERSKSRIVAACARSWDFLVDVGCGGGKFLYHQQQRFKKHLGIEVTPASRCIASESLGLNVTASADRIDSTVSVATFWHSLEHMPPHAIAEYLTAIWHHSDRDTALIISVPNGASIQYSLFGCHFAYHDSENHLHVFTPDSLLLLLGRHGFRVSGFHRSAVYAIFGYLQGIINCINSKHNYLYMQLKRGINDDNGNSYDLHLAYNILVALLLFPLATLFSVIDLTSPKVGGVITICARKN